MQREVRKPQGRLRTYTWNKGQCWRGADTRIQEFVHTTSKETQRLSEEKVGARETNAKYEPVGNPTVEVYLP